MKRISLWLAVTLLAGNTAYAQTLTGKVVDEVNVPVEFANVVLLSLPDSAFVTGTVSGEDGSFRLEASGSGHLLRVSSVGYVTVHQVCHGQDMGTLQLRADTQLLDEVVVKGSLPVTRLKGDALVTGVENTVLSKAGSGGDVLAKIPGITRGEEDTYEVFGKGEPLIYINGRQVRDMTELEQLNSEDIKEVEVIRNPGARYDATVNAVVRIRTVKRQGEGLGVNLRSSYYQSENVDLVEQADINYRYKGWDVFGTFKYDRTYSEQHGESRQSMQTDRLQEYNNSFINKNRKQYVMGDIGVNYMLDDRNSIGLKYTVTNPFKMDATCSRTTCRQWTVFMTMNWKVRLSVIMTWIGNIS